MCSLPNDYFLMDYGFISEDNPHDRVQLKFDLRLFEAASALGKVRLFKAHDQVDGVIGQKRAVG